MSHLPVGAGATLQPVVCGCGLAGCLQATLSDRAMVRHANAAGLLPSGNFTDLLAALEAGAPWAVELFRDRAMLVGRAVGLLLDVINPEIMVVVEAGVVRNPELLDELRAEVARFSHVCADPGHTVVASSFGPRALGIAAGSVVLNEAYSHPLELNPPPART